jgi:N-acetyl-alpha-D-muramate 1-phosphate uridylyltransferase
MRAPQKAMLLSAGLGKRMKPLTDNLPKPLIPVAGMTLIDRALDWFAEADIEEAVVNTHYMADKMAAHLAGRTQPRVHISYENVVLETGGGIKKALPFFADAPFFSANSDVVCLDRKTPALHRLAEAWDDARMDALLLLYPVSQAVGYEGAGDFFLEGGKLRRRLGHASAPLVFTGAQMLHPRLFHGAPEGPFSLNLLYNRAIAEDGTLARVAGIVHDGDWLHVGDPKGLAAAEAFLSENRKNLSYRGGK